MLFLGNLSLLCFFGGFQCCKNYSWIEIPSNSIWLRARSLKISHCTWGHATTLHDFRSVLGQHLETFFELSQFHGHGSWVRCEVVLNHDVQCQLLNWMTFSQLRQPLTHSKYIHWASHKFFVCPNFTYPTLDIQLYGLFYSSFSNSKSFIKFCSIELRYPIFFLTWFNKLSIVTYPWLKTGFRRRRRLVGGSGFEKMRVDSWHIQTLPHHISSTLGQVCPHSH